MRGSIRKRASKNGVVGWRIRVEYPPDPMTGKRLQKHETRRTKAEAEERLRELLNEVHRGANLDGERITVADFLQHWLDTHGREQVRATTLRSYEQQVRNHLVPHLGRHRLGRLQRAHVQAALTSIRDGGRKDGRPGSLSARSLRTIHQVLHDALNDAVDWGLIPANPAQGAKPGRVPRSAVQVWEPDQLRRFLEAAEPDPVWGPLWLTEVATGLRLGELLGLSWEQVDLERQRLHVTRIVTRIAPGGVPVFSEPKTEAGRRVVPIDATCTAALREHRREQAKRRLASGPAWAPYDLVFCVAGGGPIGQTSLHKRFRRFTRQAGLSPIRFHDLRHSHATLLLREGVPAKIVSERLGHASIAITLDTYSHVLPDMQQVAVAALELGLFQGARGHSVDTA